MHRPGATCRDSVLELRRNALGGESELRPVGRFSAEKSFAALLWPLLVNRAPIILLATGRLFKGRQDQKTLLSFDSNIY